MKKAAKGLLLIMFITVLIIALSGCGNKNKNNNENQNSKIVATKSESDSYFGEFKQTIEVSFNNDKAETIVIIYEFTNEETVKGIASMFSLAGSEQLQGIETKQDGTKFIMSYNAKAYAEQQNVEEVNLSRDYFINSLGNDGYEIQQ